LAGACSHKPTTDGKVNERVLGISKSEQANYTGQPVEFNHVKVQKVTNDHEVWVGPNENETMAVIIPADPATNRFSRKFDVREGDMVNVTGTLQPAQTGPGSVVV